jgi:hypothetical protein
MHPRPTRLALAALTLLAAAGCAASKDEATTTPAESIFGHVHGIGLNPGDGLVYVASHNGVFHLDDGSPALVANRAQDTMGFTIAGPDQFLASGHPAPGSTDPNPLGLIRSTDRASSWSSLSLGGTADFHAIDTAGNATYAYGSAGEILASDDGGTTWRTIVRGQFIDIAANPTAPDQLLATTETGTLTEITDGAQPAAVEGAPQMVFVDRTLDGEIVGVGPTGSVYLGTSDGRSWTAKTSLNSRPEALSVRSETWFAATDDGLFQSTDDGATWERLLIKTT